MNEHATRIAVFASGNGSNLQAILDHFDGPAFGVAEVALVVSDKPTAGALDRARARDIPAHVVHHADAPAIERLLDALRIELVVLAGYLKFVPAEVVRAWHGRILNVHPALLPAFGGPGMYGLRVHAAVLAAGARTSGPTVYFVDEQYDHGPVIAQEQVPVLPGDTPQALAARVLEAEHRLYPRVIADVAAGRVRLSSRGEVIGASSPSLSSS